MRDFTKSMLSLSWAMSLFGLKQMASLLNPQSNAAASFEAVTRSAEDQLGPVARSTFHSGDNLQRGLVDLMFSFFTLGLWQGRGGRPGQGGWGSGGWGPCGDASRNDWSRGDAGQPAAWPPPDTGQQSQSAQPGDWTVSGAGQQGDGWTVGGTGQPAGWSPDSGGGWQVGGGGGMGNLAAQTMGWGIDMMQQGANAVSQTLESAASPQPAAQGEGGWTVGGGSDPR